MLPGSSGKLEHHGAELLLIITSALVNNNLLCTDFLGRGRDGGRTSSVVGRRARFASRRLRAAHPGIFQLGSIPGQPNRAGLIPEQVCSRHGSSTQPRALRKGSFIRLPSGPGLQLPFPACGRAARPGLGIAQLLHLCLAPRMQPAAIPDGQLIARPGCRPWVCGVFGMCLPRVPRRDSSSGMLGKGLDVQGLLPLQLRLGYGI